MIKKYFETFKKNIGAISFPPSEENDIIRVNNFLQEHDFAKIPLEYQDFLAMTNGFIYNGVEFFGTINHYRQEKKYTFPDLIATNMHYEKYDFFHNKIIIGRLSENMIFYDQNSQYYAIVDRLSLRSRHEVQTFGQLLEIFYSFLSPTL